MMDEWEIENFSCWNDAIHVKRFYGVITFSSRAVHLFPRGDNGTGEHITVGINVQCDNSSSEVFFVGSDGSAICTGGRKHSKKGRETITGPKFEEVVAGIKRNEPRCRDRLILRWNTWEGEQPKRFRTVVYASSAFFEVKPEMLDSNDWKKIYNLTFPSIDEKERCLCVSAHKSGSTLDDSVVKFKVENQEEGKVFVRTSIWMLNNNRNIIRRHENDCVLIKERDQITQFAVLLKDVHQLKAIMRCKILTGRVYHDCDITFLTLSPYIKITNSSIFSEIDILGNQSNDLSDATRESSSSSIPRDSQTDNAVAVLAKDLMCLYQDNQLSDLELRCGTVTFPTHKNILSVRSLVFKTMLSGDMREAACGHVDVEDLDPHILGRFLSFLYSGATGEEALTWEEASKLYYAAEKYQVPSLKKECSRVLRKSVAIENVCDILSLADRHQDEELRSVAHDFILKHYNKVLKSENWEKIISENSLLGVKTLTHVTKNKYVSINDSK